MKVPQAVVVALALWGSSVPSQATEETVPPSPLVDGSAGASPADGSATATDGTDLPTVTLSDGVEDDKDGDGFFGVGDDKDGDVFFGVGDDNDGDDFFGNDFFGDLPVDGLTTCKEENLNDYALFETADVVLADSGFASCFASSEVLPPYLDEDKGGDPYEALYAKIMADDQCAELAAYVDENAGTITPPPATEDDEVDLYSLLQRLQQDVTEDVIEDACAIAAAAKTCLRKVAKPAIIDFYHTEEYHGCCAGLEETEEGALLISTLEESLDVLDAIVCDVRYPPAGEEGGATQRCGYTLLQGVTAGNDLSDVLSNLWPWMQIPQGQACAAFAGESFLDTRGDTSALFPSSPLRNCAAGHDQLFSLMKARWNGMLEMTAEMMTSTEDPIAGMMGEVIESLSLEDMFTEKKCFDIASVIGLLLSQFMTMTPMIPGTGILPSEFFDRRVLKEMRKGRGGLQRLLMSTGRAWLLSAGRAELLSKIRTNSNKLRRRMDDGNGGFGFLENVESMINDQIVDSMLGDMPYTEALKQVLELCIHFPTDFSAFCDFPGPPESSQEEEGSNEKLATAGSSSSVPSVLFVSLLFAVGISGVFLFA
eukprot:CAMPEP_0194268214 /NCGR_PEP_ID=MMETSP0169-20130528/2577_1 /TAXON_ID=218684 /ORGANISM="Corethron pennatum, Strain L29A3" /LENGTH=594 /DNA_ID=CAMNT_0039009355 /DNA_START=68 /DNA_END=1852 /DNA_ORIENTATION=+